ncbi:MAG: hypothetical protein J4G16_14000 [Acidobacteria bacterium]|nr:hypothetical protein [Acidobacteriota bacterium]
MNRLLLSLGLLACLGLPSAAPAAQTPYRVFVAPLSGNQVSDGPTRHEYVMLFGQREECAGIVPTSREDRADFTVWFEYETVVHSMLLWDAHGDLVSERSGVFQQHNIVNDVCDAIREHLAE